MKRSVLLGLPLLFLALSRCSMSDPPPAPFIEPHVACAERDPLRRPFFGDLHVHTTFSFDAHIFDVRNTPDDAYRFARGEAVSLPPLDANGKGTRTVRLDRPLDFAAVTDHSEYLGEVEQCTVPSSPAFDSDTCIAYRGEPYAATTRFGFPLTLVPPRRFVDVCGDDGKGCASAARSVWQRIQSAADAAYDKSESCRFTSFVAYEYTGVTGGATQHRNVIFKNDRVPEPTTYFEQPTAEGLWQELDRTCRKAGTGCDVLAIPHNSNESNGRMFHVEAGGGEAEERANASLRRSFEPVAEVYQHKGDSECKNGLAGVAGAPDEQCDFEKRPRKNLGDCGDGVGGGGVTDSGCFSRRDFVRGALLEGLRTRARLGVNPYQLGMIASTDTHNGTPGFVDERTFGGHRGTDDDTPAKQLGPGVLTPGGISFSGGGLVGVWAEENTRDAIFAALARREAFGTSGPRIAVRFFGGKSFDASLCADPALVAKGYAGGVPMGGTLGASTSAPTFVVVAEADPGPPSQPGTPLQRIQIVKGWASAGLVHETVYDVAGSKADGTVDDATCTRTGPDTRSLCAAWTDPAFDPAADAFYYVRVLEQPTCRWNAWVCNALLPADRPAVCSDPAVPRTIQERAWTSPIWYEPR